MVDITSATPVTHACGLARPANGEFSIFSRRPFSVVSISHESHMEASKKGCMNDMSDG
jgi:hypothetical protein